MSKHILQTQWIIPNIFFLLCNKTRNCVYIQRVKINVFFQSICYSELSHNTRFFTVTNCGIVRAYIICRVKACFKKKACYQKNRYQRYLFVNNPLCKVFNPTANRLQTKRTFWSFFNNLGKLQKKSSSLNLENIVTTQINTYRQL